LEEVSNSVLRSHLFETNKKIKKKKSPADPFPEPSKPCSSKANRGENHAEIHANNLNSLPILGDVEAPIEPEVLLLVVVDEARGGIVVAASEHSLGGLFLVDCGAVTRVSLSNTGGLQQEVGFAHIA